MKPSLVIAALMLVLLGTTSAAQQPPIVDYVITPRIFALAGAGSDEAVIIGSEAVLRTRAGQQASVHLTNSEGTDGTKLIVVPTDLGPGRVALRVEFSLIRAGQSTTAKFDVLSGALTQPATVAFRDGSGRYIRDQFGRQICATFDVVTRERR